MSLIAVRGIYQFAPDWACESLAAVAYELFEAILTYSNLIPRPLGDGTQVDQGQALNWFRQEARVPRSLSRGVRISLADPHNTPHVWYFRSGSGMFPLIHAYVTSESHRSAGHSAAKQVVSRHPDRVYWRSLWGTLGPPGNIHIVLKSRALAGLSNSGEVRSPDKMAAASALRVFCLRAGENLFVGRSTVRISAWPRADRRFVGRMDAELKKNVGEPELRALIDRLGIAYPVWMGAASTRVWSKNPAGPKSTRRDS